MGLAGVAFYFTAWGNPLETIPFVVRMDSMHNGYSSFGTYLVTVLPYL